MNTPQRGERRADKTTGEITAPPGKSLTPAEQRQVDEGFVDPAEPGTDVVLAQSTPELMRYLASGSATVMEDPEQVSFQIVKRILEATSVDEVLSRTTVQSAEDVLGFPLMVEKVEWHQSAFDSREARYALVFATRVDSKEPVLVACGGRNVMAQLWRIGELDAFPCALRFGRTAKPTAAGYYPLWLEPAV